MFNPDENRPTDWFEELYFTSNKNGEGIPWANMKTHPYFQECLELEPLDGKGKKAIVVGCGLGDDAIELEKRGYKVTAFDVSESAIAFCKERFPYSSVSFLVADLFNYPEDWKNSFDFVLEIYTVQALPPRYETEAIGKISDLVAEKGILLVISQVNEAPRDFKNGPPWLLTPGHRNVYEQNRLTLINHSQKKTTSGSNWVYFSWFEGTNNGSDHNSV